MARRIRYDAWSNAADWRSGVRRGTELSDAGVVLGESTAVDGWEGGFWATPWHSAGFRFTELVASWAADTPPGSRIEVRVIGDRPEHPLKDNHVLADWSSGASPERRGSAPGTARLDEELDVDVWRPSGGATTYALLVRLFRRPGTPGPTLRSVGAVVSAPPDRRGESAGPASVAGRAGSRPAPLDVPRLSQMDWRDAGGGGWCSPTAVSMVLAHLGRLPPEIDVPAAALEVFDPAYDGTGNWSFNTSWAATLAGRAFVTRLRDLRDAERFVDAGIPLVASVAYGEGLLTGAAVSGTDGHLIVICGFTDTGDVVVNDPAGASTADVRRTYDRDELERAWLGGSGGLVYVIHDADHDLPPRGDDTPW